ncbi:HD domain-containing protein [Streptomyces sp. cmx-18-6]|uniref:HD domain-containing protein n=1 Tax=Streptomyces sp. cmx-18-6 TaxID=2790930 RepID=UPI00397E93B9
MRVFDSWHDWNTGRRELALHAPSVSLERLDAAVEFARRFHGTQRRPAGEPYAEHLFEVVEILVLGAGIHDEDVLISAVLHDVVEDTDCTIEEVREAFGPRVAELVAWVTKPDPAPGEDPGPVRLRYLHSIRSAPQEVVSLKLADRYSNVQRLGTHPRPEKQRSYYRETCENVLPLAAGIPWFEDTYRSWRDAYRHLDTRPA